jgi:PD-(D/E)XK nuclease superfamily
MAHLYVNSSAYEVRTHSFSGSETFNFCPQKYKLTRVDGWNEIGTSAARLFGLALESAVKTYHETGLDLEAGLVHFTNEWTDIKELHTFEKWAEKNEFSPQAKATLKRLGIKGFRAGDQIKYTATEGNWENLLVVGQEMLKLYHLRLPLFPIDLAFTPKFQVKYYKELFPSTDMAGIEFVSYIDMLTRSKASLGDGLIVDIKTSSYALDTTPGILALDQQLRTYAWVTGVPDVAFLWFQKTGRSLERGSNVSLLEAVRKFVAGQSAVVIKSQEAEPAKPADPEKPRSKPKEAVPEETWIVENEDVVEQMFEHCGKGQTGDEKTARNIFIRENATLVKKEQLTRQRVQFQTAHIGLVEQLEASRQIGQDAVQIVYSSQENYWPKRGSIRGMDKKCLNCPMRGICLTNESLRDTLVYRNNEEWAEPAETD